MGMTKYPDWIFYREDERMVPKEGDVFAVEEVERGLISVDGERVVSVTMRKWTIPALDTGDVHVVLSTPEENNNGA